MPNLNDCHFIGHLGDDPKANTTPNGNVVCNFSFATNSGTKEKPRAQWHRGVVWGSQATELAIGGSKGDVVELTGELEYREYTDKEGVKRKVAEIKVGLLKLTKKKERVDEFVEE